MLTPPAIRLAFALAVEADAPEIAALRIATARDLTARFGRGHWSGETSERGVLAGLRDSKVWVARRSKVIVATFRLSTTKPWAIDRAYFARSSHPLYLTDLAVRPDLQGQGIGRRCLDNAVKYAKVWPADAIRLDAYDSEAGASDFYIKCEFREVGHVAFRGVPLTYFERLLEQP
ncbi:MAG: GNAT family N-acetyltransferase [bacterium]